MGISKSAFTLSGDNLLQALKTPCWISKAYNPKGKDKHPIKQYDALWDTGATGTVISKRVAQELGIHPSVCVKYLQLVVETQVYAQMNI